jgi:hypothetical protein
MQLALSPSSKHAVVSEVFRKYTEKQSNEPSFVVN